MPILEGSQHNLTPGLSNLQRGNDSNMAQLLESPATPQFTYRDMFATVVFAALAIIARKSLEPASPTWAWVTFGALLFGGQQVVLANARGAFQQNPRRAVPSIVLMVAMGALFGFVIHRL